MLYILFKAFELLMTHICCSRAITQNIVKHALMASDQIKLSEKSDSQAYIRLAKIMPRKNSLRNKTLKK